MGEVYRCIDRANGEQVAVKVMHPGAGTDRFLREGRALASLRHPGIVDYVAHGITDRDGAYVAMQWLEGESLSQRLKRGVLGTAASITVARRTAEALAAAHAAGIVHRDVKPGNLFLMGGKVDQLKLLDFGIARVDEATQQLTSTGAILGTPSYTAPEQARGEADIDGRADLFALGCVLFRCLTGRPAFQAEDSMAVLLKIVLEEAPHLCDVDANLPAALDDLVFRMLAKRREDRPRSAEMLATELQALSGLRDEAPRTTQPPRSITSREQRLMSLVLARQVGGADTIGDDVPTRVQQAAPIEIRDVHEVVTWLGERLEVIGQGCLLVRIAQAGSVRDQAARAARCALAIRKVMPDATVSVVSGRAEMSGALPVGDVIERGIALLEQHGPSAIAVDWLSSGLLDAAFEVIHDESGVMLVAERERPLAARTLLGREAPCVGRRRELRALEGLYEECVEDPRARPVLVVAPPGLGKSRVRYELLRRLEAQSDAPRVWMARGDPVGTGSPFGMIGRALRREANIGSDESSEAKHDKLRAWVAERVEASEVERVAVFSAELAGVALSDRDRPQLRAARQNPRLYADQLRRAFADLVRAECAERPLLLVLEDLQWGDGPTVELLDATLQTLAECPLMVLALARPETHDRFPLLWSERGLQEIRLDPLTKKASLELVRAVLGDAAGEDEMASVVEHADGNPFFLEELIRVLANHESDTLPDTALAVTEARLERIDPSARRVLRAASVFGHAFWPDGVARLLGSEGQSLVGRWMHWLEQEELVSPRQDSRFRDQPELVFRHAIIRDAAYATLTPEDRRLAHRLAGEWLEETGENDAMVLAEHFEHSAAHERAVPWFCEAAELALQGGDVEGALDRARRGVDAGASAEALGRLRLVEATGLRLGGDRRHALERNDEAWALLPSGSRAWYLVASEIVVCAAELDRTDRLNDVGRALLSALSHPDALGPRLMALTRLATSALLSGDQALAKRMFEAIAADADAAAALPEALAGVLRAREVRAGFSGDRLARLRTGQARSALLEDLGDLRGACGAKQETGTAFALLGDFDSAESVIGESLRRAEVHGFGQRLILGHTNMALVLARLGRLREARESVDKALRGAKGRRVVEGGARTYLSLIAGLEGRFEEAVSEAKKAVEIFSGTPAYQPLARGVLGAALLAKNEPEAALTETELAMNLLESLTGVDEGEELLRLVHAKALGATGQLAPAQGAITAARDRLLEQAGRIDDAELRASFLERIPEHAETLELASAWLDAPSPDARPL